MSTADETRAEEGNEIDRDAENEAARFLRERVAAPADTDRITIGRTLASYAATALAGSGDNGDRYAAKKIRDAFSHPVQAPSDTDREALLRILSDARSAAHGQEPCGWDYWSPGSKAEMTAAADAILAVLPIPATGEVPRNLVTPCHGGPLTILRQARFTTNSRVPSRSYALH